MNLINKQTGQAEPVSYDELGNKFLSGNYGIPKGESVYLTGPDGSLDQYVAEDVYAAVTKGGYKFPTSSEIQQYEDKAKYGNRPISAGALSTADAATFGLATRLGTWSGLISKETAEKLPQFNPAASAIGSAVGIGGSLILSPEAAALKMAGEALGIAKASGSAAAIAKAEAEYRKAKNTLTALDAINPVSALTKTTENVFEAMAAVPQTASAAQKLSKTAVAGAAQGAIEGTAYALGEINREHALGNPNTTASEIISDLGFSAVLGGGLNSIARTAITAATMKKPTVFAEAIRDSTAEQASKLAPSIDDTLKAASQKVPTSPEEVERLIKDYKVPDDIAELPGRKRLSDIVANNPDLPPVLEPQFKSLESKDHAVKYSNFLERGEGSENFLKWEAFQKQQGMRSLEKQISDLAGGNPIDSKKEAANKIVKDFLTDYETKKKELSPVFEKIKNVTSKSSVPASDMIAMLEEAVPQASKFIEFNPEKQIFVVNKYFAGTGMNRSIHKAVKDFADVINRADSTVGDLWLFRQELDDLIYKEMAPAQKTMVSNMRKMLLDVIDKSVPDAEVRKTFKEYAINETNIETLEQIFGGKIRTVIGKGKPFVPEKAIDKIFSNSVNVELAKSALGQTKFNEVLGHYLSAAVKKTTDEAGGGFSSKGFFNSTLKNKEDIFSAAFKDSPASLQKIYDTIDYMRILPDKPSANPAGTAKSIYNMVKAAAAEVGYSPTGIAIKLMKDVSESKMLASEIAEWMRTGPGAEMAKNSVQKYDVFSVIGAVNKLKERAIKKMASKAELAVTGGWDIGKSRMTLPIKKAPSIATVTVSDLRRKNREEKEEKLKQYKKTTDNINKLIQNPTALAESLEKMTDGVAAATPATAAAIHSTAIRGLQFLASKMPKNPVDSLFQKPYEPSDLEVSKFMTYKNTVDAPLSVLDSLKDNSISVEQIETLNAVYPELYNSMRFQIMEKVVSLKADLPYQKKLSLSMFLGKDVDSSLKPQMIQANQQSFAAMKAGGSGQKDMVGVKPTAKSLGSVNLSNRAVLPMDKSANRMERD